MTAPSSLPGGLFVVLRLMLKDGGLGVCLTAYSIKTLMFTVSDGRGRWEKTGVCR